MFLFVKVYFIVVQLICIVMLFFTIQQSDSVIHINTLFSPILFHYGLSLDVEYHPLYHTHPLLFTHTLYNSVHLLIPIPPSICLPRSLPIGDHKS